MDEGSTPGPTVVERIRRVRNDLAPAERRVVEALLARYPMAGLGSVAQLAAAAGTSAPTVLRLLGKLGFDGYPAFRERLRGEVAARLFSSDDVYPSAAAEHPLGRAERAYAENLRATFRGLDADEFARAVAAVADPANRVLVVGGRFSAVLAAHLAWYLQTLRPDVVEVLPEAGHRARALLSVDEGTLLVIFDYPPYQPDTVEFATAAAQLGARLLLVCDRNLSPIAPGAEMVLATAVDGPPPFASTVGGLMVVETLIGAVAGRLGAAARQRLAAFEAQFDQDGESAVLDFGPDFGPDVDSA
jgi:DNA-binding MurR/RpiR family transcriptional regulator